MRMTNKIMQNNSLYNINATKILEDKYNTQLTSQSKITRPSDDPVIAIRALRLRSNVSNATQYYDKNAPDANQWLDVTAQSLDTITDVLNNLYNQVETGVNKDYTASDMQVLLTQIEAYTNEMYATGNQDYAGRYIFTGYRTDTAMTMTDNDATRQFNITEKVKAAQVDSFSYTNYSTFDNTADAKTATELKITNAEIHRVRLSYNTLQEKAEDGTVLKPEIVFPNTKEFTAQKAYLESNGFTFSTVYEKDKDGNDVLDKDGNRVISGYKMTNTIDAYSDCEAAYKDMTAVEQTQPVPATDSKVMYIPSTGELLLSSNLAVALGDSMENGVAMEVTYDKNQWLDGDLSPVHYFACVETTKSGGTIPYNTDGNVDTEITYDVGYNQVIQINTNASEVFDPAIKRDYDDLKSLVSQFTEIEKIKEDLTKELDGYVEGTADYKNCQTRLDAANKAYTYIRDAVSTRFGNQITRYQGYLDATNVAITKNGTRSTRLALIKTRLEDQKSTFRELQEENEGIDMTEVAVLLTSAKTTYDAALMATGKISQNSLINYI